MPLSGKNYKVLYQLQDKVLEALKNSIGIFHLTGGTALGRFYLNHRYSEDLDLFTNKNPGFADATHTIRTILRNEFNSSDDELILYQDFIRVWVPGKEKLKVEMVNDVAERWGNPLLCNDIPIDTVGNILANKLTAVVSRDEPKDVFDIVSIASHYAFNWADVFVFSLRKAIIAEPDVAMRIKTFPVEMLKGKDWLMKDVDYQDFQNKLNSIGNDFLFGNDNSLGAGKTPIQEAKPKILV